MKMNRRKFLASVAAAIAAPAVPMLKPGAIPPLGLSAGDWISVTIGPFPPAIPPPYDLASIERLMAGQARRIAEHLAQNAAVNEAGRRHDAELNRLRRIELGLPPEIATAQANGQTPAAGRPGRDNHDSQTVAIATHPRAMLHPAPNA